MGWTTFDSAGALITTPQLPQYVTSLPSSPVDGQTVYYQPTALSTAGVVYTMRYNAAAAKWQFVGGQPQTASTTKTDVYSSSSTTFADITGLSVSITPTFSTSKILITASVITSNNGTNLNMVNLVRGSTNLAQPASATYSASLIGTIQSDICEETLAITHLDSPSSTSNLTYKLQMRVSSGTGYVNQRASNTTVVGTSQITVQEVVG